MIPLAKASTQTRQNSPSHKRHYSVNGFREAGIAFMWAFIIAAPILGAGGWKIYGSWRDKEDQRLATIEMSRAYERLIASAPGQPLQLDTVIKGREFFASTCAVCHGADARGVTGLGMDLVRSNYIASNDDAALRNFIIAGRPDARPIPMPPMAGRDDLSTTDLDSIVAYLRGLQDPRRMPDLPEQIVDNTPTSEQVDAALNLAGGDPELAQWIASGDKIYHSACIACHGRSGAGVPGNGLPLVRNTFIQSLDDDALFDFITRGRTPSDPQNTTGIQMPPKGGNPAMSEDDILDVIAYLRTLQGQTHGAAGNK